MRDETQGGEPGNAQRHDFESMNLQIGTRLQLFTHRHIKPAQHFSMLIGYVKDEYLLVKMPFDNGTHVNLLDGEKVTVRAFSGTSICSFASTVLRTFLHPFFYVHLAFPQMIESTSLRRAMRVKVNLRGQVKETQSGGASAVDVVVSNLSVAGALLESQEELGGIDHGVGLSVVLHAQPSDQEIRIDTRAIIRNVNLRKASSSKQQDVYMYGVQFVDLNSNQQLVLQNLTYEALLTDRQNIV